MCLMKVFFLTFLKLLLALIPSRTHSTQNLHELEGELFIELSIQLRISLYSKSPQQGLDQILDQIAFLYWCQDLFSLG